MPEQTFAASGLLQAGGMLRGAGSGAASLEEAATTAVAGLREQFVDKATGRSALPLVRLYVTERSDHLPPDDQDFARAAAPDAFRDRNVVCLTLLGTAGEEPGWNDRSLSVGHRAIPLPSVEALRRLPMIAQLVAQLGVDARRLVEPDPQLLGDLEERTYNVFYVAEALDSPYVPAQNTFVVPQGIRSVVGFGGVLPGGRLFAVVMFSSVPIPPSSVDAFAMVALSLKVALLDHATGPTLAGRPPPERSREQQADLESAVAASKAATLLQLLDAQAALVDAEVSRLQADDARIGERRSEEAAAHQALAASEARKTAIIEGALDCIIGMDDLGRITDFNGAAERTFGYGRGEVTGEMLADFLIPPGLRERHRLGLADYLRTGRGPVIGRRIEITALRRDGTGFPIELTVVREPGSDPAAFSGYVRDISDRRRAEAELAASREGLARIARTLQASLLPPVLPVIDGADLVAAFQAHGEGYEVGGDFYDAFELGDGTWGLVLGDVCGKGSEAAVITALARYTVRAAAMRSNDPAHVLRTLNDAIARQHPDSFCTAVFATFDPATGAVELALGGHPRPLLLSASGDVRAVGHPNPLLGPYEPWVGSTDSFTLGTGDMLVCYSDGVTEARAGRDFFGEERLAVSLRAAHGGDADAVVRRVEADVIDFAGSLSDDLAILAVRRHR